MGSIISTVFNKLFSKRPMKILMVGLDGVGKTTILFRLKLGEAVIQTIPTIGFNVETVEHKNVSFIVWDIGGGDKIRQLWRHYLADTDGIICVVDSSDRERIQEVSPDLHRILDVSDSRESILLVFANKQDLPNSMSTAEITDKLDLKTLRNTKWYVQEACATQGNGLYEGLDWLSNELAKATK